MRRYWTTTEIRRLREIYPNMLNVEIGRELGRTRQAVHLLARKLGLSKLPEFIRGACRFQKGNATWNAGKNWNAGGRSGETRFKKGHRGARQRPVGAERVTTDGIVEVKVAEPNVWDSKARVVWREHFGEIPEGYIVRVRDRAAGYDIENLLLLTRAENGRLTSQIRRPRGKKAVRRPAWIGPVMVSA